MGGALLRRHAAPPPAIADAHTRRQCRQASIFSPALAVPGEPRGGDRREPCVQRVQRRPRGHLLDVVRGSLAVGRRLRDVPRRVCYYRHDYAGLPRSRTGPRGATHEPLCRVLPLRRVLPLYAPPLLRALPTAPAVDREHGREQGHEEPAAAHPLDPDRGAGSHPWAHRPGASCWNRNRGRGGRPVVGGVGRPGLLGAPPRALLLAGLQAGPSRGTPGVRRATDHPLPRAEPRHVPRHHRPGLRTVRRRPPEHVAARVRPRVPVLFLLRERAP